MSLQLYASAALSGLPPLNGGSMLALIAATEASSRVVLRLRHQVVKDHIAHHPPPPVEHPRPQSSPRRVQLAAFSRIGSSAVLPSEHDHEVDRLMRCEHRRARLLLWAALLQLSGNFGATSKWWPRGGIIDGEHSALLSDYLLLLR